MRTTVTLDADVQAMLKEAAFRTGRPFKATLNDAVRAGLGTCRAAAVAALPDWPTFDLGPSLVDMTKAMALADELDDAERVARGFAGRAGRPE